MQRWQIWILPLCVIIKEQFLRILSNVEKSKPWLKSEESLKKAESLTQKTKKQKERIKKIKIQIRNKKAKPWEKSEESLKKAESKITKTEKQKEMQKKRIKKIKIMIKKRKIKHAERIEKLQLQVDLTQKTRDYNLGTSLRNYIDPRIFKTWTDEVDAEWEKLYTSALQKKFLWVKNVNSNWNEISKQY